MPNAPSGNNGRERVRNKWSYVLISPILLYGMVLTEQAQGQPYLYLTHSVYLFYKAEAV
jgi:hypothetical protein